MAPSGKVRDQHTQDTPSAVMCDKLADEIVEPKRIRMEIRVHHGLDTDANTGPLF